jgi:hypothetical protein
MPVFGVSAKTGYVMGEFLGYPSSRLAGLLAAPAV